MPGKVGLSRPVSDQMATMENHRRTQIVEQGHSGCSTQPWAILSRCIRSKRMRMYVPARKSESDLFEVSHKPSVKGNNEIAPHTASRFLESSGNPPGPYGCARLALAPIPPFSQCRLNGQTRSAERLNTQLRLPFECPSARGWV